MTSFNSTHFQTIQHLTQIIGLPLMNQYLFGVKSKLPHGTYPNEIDPVFIFDLYSNELKFKLQKSHQIVQNKLLEQKYLRKESTDSLVNPIKVKVGDTVYIKKEKQRKNQTHCIWYRTKFKV